MAVQVTKVTKAPQATRNDTSRQGGKEQHMVKVLKHTAMGRSDLGWLKSLFHFSVPE